MKFVRITLAALSLLAGCLPAPATPVNFQPLYFTGETNRMFVTVDMVDELNPTVDGIHFIADDGPLKFWMPATTNLLPGVYTMSIQGVRKRWQLTISDTTNTVNAASPTVSQQLPLWYMSAAGLPFIALGENVTLSVTNGVTVVAAPNVIPITNGVGVGTELRDSAGNLAVDSEHHSLANSAGFQQINLEQGTVSYPGGNTLINLNSGAIQSSDGGIAVDPDARALWDSDGNLLLDFHTPEAATTSIADLGFATTNQVATKLSATGGIGNSNTLFNATIPVPTLYVAATFDAAIPNEIWLMRSTDLSNWFQVGTAPIINSYQWYSGTTAGTARDVRFLRYQGKLYLSYLANNTDAVLMENVDFVHWKTNSWLTQKPAGVGLFWEPHYAQPPEGGLYMFRSGGTGTTDMKTYEQHLTNWNDITSWSAPSLVGGNWPTSTIAPEFFIANGHWWNLVKQECVSACAFTALMVSDGDTSAAGLTNSWRVYCTNGPAGCFTNDWAHWGSGYEGGIPIQRLDGSWAFLQEKFLNQGYYLSTCPAAGFPTNGWSGAVATTNVGAPMCDPGLLMLTNLTEIGQVLYGEIKQNQPFTVIPHPPYYDTIIGANIFIPPSTLLFSWQNVVNHQIQRSATFCNIFTGTANDAIWDFYHLDRTTGSRTAMGSIQKSGWNGAVVGSTVSASGLMTATAGIGSKLTTTYSVTSTGYTNNNNVSVRIVGLTGTSITQSNATSGNAFSRGTITTATDIILQPGESITGSSVAAQSTRAF